MITNISKRNRRHKKVRSKISGTKKIPRFSVFISNKKMYIQIIDDEKGMTLVSASGKSDVNSAKELGKQIAEKAKEKKISKVVFDRGGYAYGSKVKVLADSAREGGLKF